MNFFKIVSDVEQEKINKKFNYDKPFEGSSNIPLLIRGYIKQKLACWLVTTQIPNYITPWPPLNNKKERKEPYSERIRKKFIVENSIKLLNENCHNKFPPIN